MIGAARHLEAQARRYRHTWRASVFSSFVNPVLFLLAMGIGLGQLVDAGDGIEISYLAFLAPGLLAATAMQTAAAESTFPVMAAIKWIKSYDAALSTPIRVRDLVFGHLGWVAIRLTQVIVIYALVIVAFDAMSLGRGLAAVPPAVLTGLAFASPIMAYTTTIKKETGLSSLFRFGIVPLFLFSGTFFPITQLPLWMQPIAWFTPLWHGVEMSRGIGLGIETAFHPAVHLGVLVVFFVGGTLLTIRLLTRKLIT